MITGLKFNPITGNLDLISKVPEVTSDPVSPKAEDAFVLNTSGAYSMSYRTKEGTTIRLSLI